MKKVIWPRLSKSILACVIAAWLGLAPIVAFEDLRFNTYILKDFASIGEWLIGGLSSGLDIFLSYFPLLVLIPMLIIGLPLQALLQRFGKVGYLWTVIPALPVGPLVLMLIFVIYGDVLKGSLDPYGLVLTAVGAFTTTSIFWLFRRPDRDELKVQTPETL